MPISGDYDGSVITVLERLRSTADLEGLAILDLSEDAANAPIAYFSGLAGDGTISLGQALLTATPTSPSHAVADDKRPLLSCPWILPPARPAGLLLWRAPRARPWTGADHSLAASVAMLLGLAIGPGMGEIGIDRLTGLPNRRWFLDEVDRHIERLGLDSSVGTLALVDIDDLRCLNRSAGREQGDRVLIRLANQLRAMVRPGDLVARVGADEFAIWQNSMDHMSAAERAEALCTRRLFQDLPDVTLSIGIASHDNGSTDDVRTLLRRAYMAAREVKAKGGGGWRVSLPAPIARLS